jgi:hypothetical protein
MYPDGDVGTELRQRYGPVSGLILFIVTVYRWFADPFRRTTGNDLR